MERGDRRRLTNKFSISYYFWIELDPHGFGMVRSAKTDILVCWIFGVSSCVSNGGLENPLLGRRVVFEEDVFYSPETPFRKRSDLADDSI